MGEVKIRLTAEDYASGVIERVQQKLGVFNEQGVAMGITFAVASQAVGIALSTINNAINTVIDSIKKQLALTQELYRVSLDFTNALNTEETATQEMSEAVKALSFAYATSISDIKKSVITFIRNGADQTTSINAVSDALKLHNVTGEETSTIADTMTNAMDAFGLSAENSNYIVQDLYKIYSKTNISFSDMGNLFEKYGTDISNTGLSLDQFSNVFIRFQEESGKGGRALTTAFGDILTDYPKLFKYAAETTVGGARDIDTAFGTVVKGLYPIRGMQEVAKGFSDIFTVKPDMTQYDDLQKLFGAATDFLETQLQDLQTELNNTNNEITINKNNIFAWQEDIQKLTTIHDVNNDLHYMSIGLLDANYATKIQNDSTKKLVDSIRTQSQEMQRLQDINDIYSLKSQKNQLEAMRIQRDALDHRGRLTRGQKQQLKELEKSDADYRIKTMENQISINEIKTSGFTELERQLLLTKTWYEEELFTVKDTYTEEMNLLKNKITDEQTLLTQNYIDIATINEKILQNEIDTYNARKLIWQGKTVTMPQITTSIEQNPLIWLHNLPRHQTGGYVTETHPAVVHRGETIIPANQNRSTDVHIHIDQPIRIQMDIHDITDTRGLAQKIELALQQGLIAGVTTKYH